MKMKGFDERVNGPGKAAPKDWRERGGEMIPKRDLPGDVLAAFEKSMDAVERDTKMERGMNELARNGGASMTFRVQSLAHKPDVVDYIMEYVMHYPEHKTGKRWAWIISVEVRDGVVGTPVIRYPEQGN